MSISFYLEHLAGSCLILFPLALLLFFPYGKERWRVGPPARYLLCAALAAAAAVTPFFDYSVAMALAMFGLVLAFFLLIRDSFSRKCATLFVSVFCMKAQVMLAYGYAAARDLLAGAETVPGPEVDCGTLLLSFLAAVVVVPPSLAFERRVLRNYLRSVSPRILWLEILLLAIVDLALCLLALFFVGMFVGISAEVKTMPAWYVVPGLLLFIAALAAIYYFTFRTTLVRALEVENRLQMELLRENSASLQRDMKHTREIYHDLRHLLRQLNTMGGQSGFHELEPYITKIVSLTEQTDAVFCENKCLNALFQYYAGCANEKQLPISISAICGDLPVEDTDLTLLTANALENAITGAEEYRAQTGQEPEISVAAGIIKHRLLFQITNSCAAVRYSETVKENDKQKLLPAEAYLSTHEGRGYGLKRIDMISEKYLGTARFQFDGEKRLWTTRIAIPLRK